MESEGLSVVRLRRGKEESLLRFHPWVFSGAIGSIEGSPTDGDTVRVVGADGSYLATGHYQGGSIAVRVLTFEEEAIDVSFFVRRVSSAFEVRRACGIAACEGNTIYRLVHGEGDNLPGLIVDIYGSTAVMQAHSVGMHRCRQTVAEALSAAVGVENVYYKSDTTLPFVDTIEGFLVGGSSENIGVENGLFFRVDWLKGQKTGFFVDQRENRALVERYAAGRRVLNMFCYTGGFSVYALRGGAALVHSVDSSAKATALTRENVALNFVDVPRHTAFCEDAFRFLEGRGAGQYDLVILDPPAFAKHRGALHNALKGYTRLNRVALSTMPAGSILFTFSCSQVVTKEQFRAAVFNAAAQAQRRVRILHQLHQAPDHPINIYHPEGEYLKGLVLYVE